MLLKFLQKYLELCGGDLMYFEWKDIKKEYPPIINTDREFPKIQKLLIILNRPSACNGKYSIECVLFTDHFYEVNENKILYWAVIPLPDELINNTKMSPSIPLLDNSDICANCAVRYICEEQEEFDCKQNNYMYYTT